jgi:hypothetical protein
MVRRELENLGIFKSGEAMLHAGLDEERIAGCHNARGAVAFHQDATFVDVKGFVLHFVMVKAAAEAFAEEEQFSAIIAINDPTFLAPFFGDDFDTVRCHNAKWLLRLLMVTGGYRQVTESKGASFRVRSQKVTRE